MSGNKQDSGCQLKPSLDEGECKRGQKREWRIGNERKEQKEQDCWSTGDEPREIANCCYILRARDFLITGSRCSIARFNT